MIQKHKIDFNDILVRVESQNEGVFVIEELIKLGYSNAKKLMGGNGYYNNETIFPFYGIINNVINYKHFNHKEIMESKLRLISLHVFKKMLSEQPVKGVKRKLEL